MAKSLVYNSQVFNMPVHPGENSTYNLKFRGPQLRCTYSKYNNTFPMEYVPSEDEDPEAPDTLIAPAFESRWDRASRWYRASRDASLCSIATHNTLNYTLQRTSKNVISFEGFRETSEQICKAHSVLYDVNISFPRGLQTVQHSMSNLELLSPLTDYAANYDEGGIMDLVLPLPADTQALQDWNRRMQVLLPLANEWALLDALGRLLEDMTYETSDFYRLDSHNFYGRISSNSTNGTTIYDYDWQPDMFETMNVTCKSTCLT
jgi:hypothetical protein